MENKREEMKQLKEDIKELSKKDKLQQIKKFIEAKEQDKK